MNMNVHSLYRRYGWMLGLRGLVAVIFGVLMLSWPQLTLLGLASLFAAYALLAGGLCLIQAIRQRDRDEDWWIPFLLGAAGVLVGVIALAHPALTALVMVLLVGANAWVSGVLDIMTAIRLRKVLRQEWLLAFNGIASVVFGVAVFLFPEAGALTLVLLLGLYAIVTGILLMGVAWHIRSRTLAETRAGRTVERRITPDRRSPGRPAHS